MATGLAQLNEVQIRERMQQILEEVKDIDAWSSFAESKQGEFFKTKVEDRLAHVRDLYYKINPSDENALVHFSRVQGVEEDLSYMLTRVDKNEDYRKSLDNQFKICESELKTRSTRKSEERNQGDIIPDKVKLELIKG